MLLPNPLASTCTHLTLVRYERLAERLVLPSEKSAQFSVNPVALIGSLIGEAVYVLATDPVKTKILTARLGAKAAE